MNKKQWFGTAMGVVMMGTVLVGCGSNDSSATSGQADSKQELHLAIGDDVPSLDPALATDNYSFTLLGNTMEGLVRLDKDGQAQPGIASSWEVSQDGLTYTFHLRDAKWSNGDVVTSKDFAYSWKRTLDPKTQSQYAFMLGLIKGGSDYNTGKGSLDNVGIQTPDDKTLVVKLQNPTPFFLNQMAFPTFFPVNQKFAESKGKDFAISPDAFITDGPFKVTAWQHDSNMTIAKNADYWDAKSVKLETVTYNVVKDSNAELNMYESGELDRTALVREQVDAYKSKTDEYSTVPELTNGYLIFNPSTKGLDNAKIRTALTQAVDRDMYADIVYHNGTVAATGFVPNGTKDGAGSDFRKDAGTTLPKQDAAATKKIFEEGLKEAGMTAADLKFKLMIDDTDVAKKAGEFLQEQWRSKLGVNVDLESLPFKLRLDRETKEDYQVAIDLWGADYNDPMTFLEMFVTKNDFNKVSYSNKEYDQLIATAKTETDVKKRAQELVDAEKILMKDMPVGPMFFRGKAYATKPYVKNFVAFPYGVDYDLKTTYIQGKN